MPHVYLPGQRDVTTRVENHPHQQPPDTRLPTRHTIHPTTSPRRRRNLKNRPLRQEKSARKAERVPNSTAQFRHRRIQCRHVANRKHLHIFIDAFHQAAEDVAGAEFDEARETLCDQPLHGLAPAPDTTMLQTLSHDCDDSLRFYAWQHGRKRARRSRDIQTIRRLAWFSPYRQRATRHFFAHAESFAHRTLGTV